MNFWFTADTHFGHENIIKYTGRPFKTLYEMDIKIIKSFNERIKPDDTVFFLGDFCFRNTSGGKTGEGTENRAKHYLEQLNGNWVFVRGNHDNNNSLRTVIESMIIHHGGMKIFLCHNPEDINPYIAINLVGHVHEKWKFKEISHYGTEAVMINVGVDVWGFKPISINEILKEMTKWKEGKIDGLGKLK